MPASSVTTFVDPCTYQEAVRSARVEVLVTGRGYFRTELTCIDLHRVSMQRGQETLSRVGHGAIGPERTAIYFLDGADQAAGRHCGVQVSPGTLVINAPRSTYHHMTFANCHWGDIAIAPDDLASVCQTLAGRDLTSADIPQILVPRPAPMSRLLRLHEAAGNLAQTAPDILMLPEVARSFEQALVHALVECMTDEEANQSCATNLHHQTVLARFEELLAEKAGEPLHLPEICAAISAPERTLRSVCQRHLGMSPTHYLWSRRMHLARRTLLVANAATTTVTSIATSLGFWELGKFSVAYRSLFGEPPLATLRRENAEVPPLPRGSPFVLPSAVSA
jgi:AraC-like DNA-binding protein